MKKSKSKISSVKQKTLKHNKLRKQGKLRSRRHKAKELQPKKKSTKPVVKPVTTEKEESDHGEDMLDMIDKDDLKFLHEAVASNSYSLLGHIHSKERKRDDVNDKSDDEMPIEKQYEEKSAEVEPKKTKRLLPIKTVDGLIRRSMNVEIRDEPEAEKTPVVVPTKEEEIDSDMELELELKNQVNKVDENQPISTVQLLAAREEELRKRKIMIGVLASGLLEDPEVKAKNLKRLLDMMNEECPELRITVSKLVTISLLEVFKDIIPSYQIKHQENPRVRLKKVTLQLQGYEKTLLNAYKLYLQKLEKMISVIEKKRGMFKELPQQKIRLAELALSCMCDLLITHPYFNFSKNLVQMLVPYLNHPMPSVREMCSTCIRKLFKNDKRGEISLEIVRRINHLVKSLSHSVYPEVLNVLLSLRIKEVNLDKEKEDEMKQRKILKHKEKLLTMSRKERKRSKRLEELERELLETKAEENKQSKQQHLTEITKLVFTIYFRVLKKAPSSKILGITLEGLARYAHCINLEFYQDIVDVLNQLVEQESLGYREQLHCVQTVFAILSGQGEVLNIDPLRFYTHLYRNLFHINAGQNHCDLLIVLKTLEIAFIQRRKKMSQQRIFAFTKRLATLALQLLHNGSLGCLAIIKTIMQLNRSVDILLDPDTSVGQGIYFPELEDPEYCNASSSALWELILLERHYHPTVRKFAKNILIGVPATGEGSLSPEFSKLKPEELFTEFDGSEMIFKPAVPVPKKSAPKSKPPSHFQFKNDSFFRICETSDRKTSERSTGFQSVYTHLNKRM
ncbi:hypothetical protein L9F63_005536 [Diploptera punctata]|uniref:Nucleolar complex protein 3 homolog n=1 Tax=Diploptera punctata TaxID=6984 RepID=A0AAD7ZDL7_DIPPU|nr:hypothetical protein L9F63_005536 [Diploptera punctata]